MLLAVDGASVHLRALEQLEAAVAGDFEGGRLDPPPRAIMVTIWPVRPSGRIGMPPSFFWSARATPISEAAATVAAPAWRNSRRLGFRFCSGIDIQLHGEGELSGQGIRRLVS
jgi:hypothetical protein